MYQINEINLLPLLTGAHYDFHHRVLKAIDKASPTALQIAALYADYRSDIGLALTVLDVDTSKPFTTEIEEYDERRDASVRTLMFAAERLAKHPDPSINVDGKRLWKAISEFKGMDKYEMMKETSHIKVMLDKVKTEGLDDYVGQNVGSQILTQIETYNNTFESYVTQRIERITKVERVNRVALRKKINEEFEEIRLIVNAYAITAPSVEIEEFVKTVNALIDEFKNIIARMKRGGSGNEKLPPQEEEPGPEICGF